MSYHINTETKNVSYLNPENKNHTLTRKMAHLPIHLRVMNQAHLLTRLLHIKPRLKKREGLIIWEAGGRSHWGSRWGGDQDSWARHLSHSPPQREASASFSCSADRSFHLPTPAPTHSPSARLGSKGDGHVHIHMTRARPHDPCRPLLLCLLTMAFN